MRSFLVWAVIEIHQSWCGPCECLKPMLWRISLDKEEIKFCTAASDKVLFFVIAGICCFESFDRIFGYRLRRWRTTRTKSSPHFFTIGYNSTKFWFASYTSCAIRSLICSCYTERSQKEGDRRRQCARDSEALRQYLTFTTSRRSISEDDSIAAQEQ